MFQFPFGTMHQLNLDWFLQQWQQLRQDWIDEEQNIEDSMQDVYDARDAAILAKDDAVAAKNDAESAQAGVHADALMAEGFAVGEQNGTPVGPGSPYYQVNAKFYSMTAGTYRYLSEAYARGTMGGTPVDPGDAGYEDNAKYYKEQADLDAQSANDDAAFAAADALKSEGYSVGEQNGTPVASGSPYYENNAKHYAAEAQQDKDDADAFKDAANQAALRAEGYSSGTQNGTPVSSGSPYFENNAAYYFGNTANIDGENAQKMIAASEEASSSAASAHAAGSYFRMAGKLYQATSDIEIGNTITAGINCVEKTVVEELAAQSAKIDEISNPSVNLYDYTTKLDGTGISSSGSISSTSSFVDYSVSDYIPVEPGKTLYFSINGTEAGFRRLNTYNANKEFVSLAAENSSNFTVPSGVAYIRFSALTSIMGNTRQVQYDRITALVPFTNRTIKKTAYNPDDVQLNKKRYVSSNGNDDNDGLSSTTPFATFAKAISEGAEVLFIEAGTYSENIVQPSGRPLTIRPYNGSEIILADTETGNYRINAQFSEVDVEGVTCKGSARYGFYFAVCKGILRNCKAEDNATMGFALNGCIMNLYNCIAKNNTTDGFNAHVHTVGTTNYYSKCNFFDCVADGNGDDGLSFHEQNDFCVYGGQYINNTSGGITPAAECVAEIHNAYIYGNAVGISCQAESASTRQKVKTFGNLILANTKGIKAVYYSVISVNDVFSGNTTATEEQDGGSITIYP